jgi:hypothetical protein
MSLNYRLWIRYNFESRLLLLSLIGMIETRLSFCLVALLRLCYRQMVLFCLVIIYLGQKSSQFYANADDDASTDDDIRFDVLSNNNGIDNFDGKRDELPQNPLSAIYFKPTMSLRRSVADDDDESEAV